MMSIFQLPQEGPPKQWCQEAAPMWRVAWAGVPISLPASGLRYHGMVLDMSTPGPFSNPSLAKPQNLGYPEAEVKLLWP